MIKVVLFIVICISLAAGQPKEYNDADNNYGSLSSTYKRPLSKNSQGVQNEDSNLDGFGDGDTDKGLSSKNVQGQGYNDDNSYGSLSNAKKQSYLTDVQGQNKGYNNDENSYSSLSNKRSPLNNVQGLQKDHESGYSSLSNDNRAPSSKGYQGVQKDLESGYSSLSNDNRAPSSKGYQGHKSLYNDEDNNYSSLSNKGYLSENLQGPQSQYNSEGFNSLSNANKGYLSKNLLGQQSQYNSEAYDTLSNAKKGYLSKNLQGQNLNDNDDNSYNSLSNSNKGYYSKNLPGQQSQYNSEDRNYLSNSNQGYLSKNLPGQQSQYNNEDNNYSSSNANRRPLSKNSLGVQNDQESGYSSLSNDNRAPSSKGYQGQQNHYSNEDNGYKAPLSKNVLGKQSLHNDDENAYYSLLKAKKGISSKSLLGQQKGFSDSENQYNSLSNTNQGYNSNNFEGLQKGYSPENQGYLKNVQGNAQEQPLNNKPCSMRRSQSSHMPTEEWVPTHQLKNERPLSQHNNNLNFGRPQSLKNQESRNILVPSHVYEVNTKKLLSCINKSNKNAGDSDNINSENNNEVSELVLHGNFADGSGANLLENLHHKNHYDNTENLHKHDSSSYNGLSSSHDSSSPLDETFRSGTPRLLSKDRVLLDDYSLPSYNDRTSFDDSLAAAYLTRPGLSNSEDASLDDFDEILGNSNKQSSSDISSALDATNSRRSSAGLPSLDASIENSNLGGHKDKLPRGNYNGNTQNANLQNDDFNDNHYGANGNQAQAYEGRQKGLDLRKSFEQIETQLIGPAKGRILPESSVSRVLLMQNSRVCYACSSATDKSCWHPNRMTTVKYCRKEHDVCVTKTYRSQDALLGLIVIRDCAESCDTSLAALETKYSSCSACTSDLCNNDNVNNSSTSVTGFNMIVILFITCFMKYF